MKLGIKKNHENEWLVTMGPASIRMDRFSVELLNITLEHMVALEHGETHSELDSYVRLGKKIKELDQSGVQLLVRSVDNQDLLKFILVSHDEALALLIMKNVGGILAKQLQSDIEKSLIPDVEEAKAAIKRIVETMYDLETNGKIEFFDATTKYI